MINYKLYGGYIRRDDGVIIPVDGSNRHYQEYLEWCAAGNAPEPDDPIPVRALSMSPSQQIILADGLDVAIVTITGEPGATVEYTVNGEPFQTTLDASGQDVIELDCDTPDTTLLVQAGTARVVIRAVEVTS